MNKEVFRHQLRTSKTKGCLSLSVSGSSTSAAKLNRRVGTQCADGFVVVEGGRRISVYALSMSVRQSAENWLRKHGKEQIA